MRAGPTRDKQRLQPPLAVDRRRRAGAAVVAVEEVERVVDEGRAAFLYRFLESRRRFDAAHRRDKETRRMTEVRWRLTASDAHARPSA